MKYRFTRSLRLLTSDEYSRVFQQKEYKVGNDAFMILAAINSHGFPRMGLAIAKKQLKHAVDRNRVKRIAREQFRNCQYSLPAIDLVLLCRSGVTGLDKAQIHRKLDRLFAKIARFNHN